MPTEPLSGAIGNIVPAKLYVTYCPVCRRNDLVNPLKARHSSGGKLCRGVLRQVSYTLDGDSPLQVRP